MGYGPLVRCVTGLTSLWRYPDDPVGFADGNTVYPDHFAARVMATAALAALIARRRSGRGAHVDGAQSETILMQLSDLLALESAVPGSVNAAGNVSDEGAPHGVYPCAGADEWCVITVRTDDQWQRLCRVTGLTGLGDDPRLRTTSSRMRQRRRIDELVSGWTARHTPREVQSLLQDAGVPAGAMLRVTDYGRDPHLVAREYVAEIVQPGLGPVTVENAIVRSEQVSWPELGPAPEFGEHTREIAEQLLGLCAAEVDELVNAGVLEVPAADLAADRH
jgi:crotonobetainyl-CoA:carnitine CoA-transferase CaiB-like acyl-CoA transferase